MPLLPSFFACSPILQIDYKLEEQLWPFLVLLGPLDTCRSPFHGLSSVADWATPLGRILLTVHTNIHAQYFATFCITSGTYTSIGIIIAWCTFYAVESVSSLTVWSISCTQSWIRDQESDWHSYVYGYRAMWECPWIASLPCYRRAALYVSLFPCDHLICYLGDWFTAKDLQVRCLVEYPDLVS